MKIAITYNPVNKMVNQHFGDCENFLIYDTDTKNETIVSNGGYSHRGLVGYLKSLDVNVLICGGIGRPAVGFFAEVGIVTYPGVNMLAKDAINELINGTLKGDISLVHECGCHHHE